MQVDLQSITSIRPYHRNPRKNDRTIAAVAASIREFGFRQPIVVDTEGVIVAGHSRYHAAKLLGLTDVPVHVATDLSPAQIRAYRLADNKIAELSEWDTGLLASELADTRSLGLDPALLGFTSDEIDKLLPPAPSTIDAVGDDEIPPTPADALSRRGAVYELGRHRLICGDSTDPATFARLMQQRFAHLVVTSPPYNCSIEYDTHDDAQPRAEYLAFIRGVIAAVAPFLEPGCFVGWNLGVTPKTYHFEHAHLLADAGLRFYRQIVWAKSGVAYPTWPITTKAKRARAYHPNYVHELLYLFSKDAPRPGGDIEPDDAFANDVWKIHQAAATTDLATLGERSSSLTNRGKSTHRIKEHPAAFPVALPAAVITHLTSAGETVLEPFGGSGSTIIACEKTNRDACASELSPNYCDVARRRWAEFVHGRGCDWPTLTPEIENP